MIAEKFQIYCAKITGKHICESKILNLFILTHAPKQKLSSRFLSSLLQADGNDPFLPANIF